ncbi:MAG: chemotaxis protein CheA [Opitutae bacterium]|nr:chemotaxis protein CheA [Opitutae bacterium]
MPISSDSFIALEDTFNRIASESILAQPGRDDGLIPSYSLLGVLIELSAPEPTLCEPATALRVELEKLLDTAQPFDAATLGQLTTFIAWLPGAISALKAGKPAPAPATATVAVGAATTSDAGAAPATAAQTAVPVALDAAVDVLQELQLDDNRELLAEFHAEALDHLQQIEGALLQLEQQPDHPDALNSIFRSFHTIKGNSGFLHLVPMQKLTHEVESLLDLVRTGKLRINSAIITEVLRSRDVVQALVGQVTVALESGKVPDKIIPVSHLIAAVRRLASESQAPAPAAVVAPPPAVAPATVTPFVPAEAAPKAAAPVAPVVPFPADAAVAAAPAGPPTVASAAKAAAKAAAANGAGNSTSSSTVRVNTDKLDTLMNVVGELVIVQSQLHESSRAVMGDNSSLVRDVASLSRITKDLQHTAMALRMIPIKPTFQKMERLSRDLARECGKKVVFLVSGEDTELDRTVVEEIGDPLVHMVRNSLDHGLEPAADRLAKGKPEAGTVHLKAYHQGSNIVIEMSDDGRGIDPARIVAKAIEKGLLPPDAQLSKEDALNLIFLPGFSTAEKITSVSGRGVGMDVVRRNIVNLRGKIEIESEVGKGSVFRIKLPLTMAIIDGLVVRVGGDHFILPSTSVQMALRPPQSALFTVQGKGEALELRGKIIPLYRLHERFSIPHAITVPSDGIVVLVESGGRTRAVLVDEMVRKQEVVIKNLGAYLQGLPGVAGGAILGDGSIALIIDPASLFAAA